MANIGQLGSMEAIQILKSEEQQSALKNVQHVIRIVDVYKDGPSLKEVLCSQVNKDLPTFVFSVTGKTRGGKSFLLNLMIKYLENMESPEWMRGRVPSVFDWQGGKDSITKGLWICPKIYKMRNKSGQEVGILLLDNQGLFDGEQTDGESIAMSGISTAISHIQMFNISHKIVTHDLESIWRHLVTDNGCSPAVDTEYSTSTLMFVVRDFIEEEEGCGLNKGQEYIEEEKQRGTEEHKLMWNSLQQNFRMLKCLLLPHPGLAVTKKDYSKNGDLSVVEESFMKEIDLFFREVFAPESLNLTNTNSLTGSQIYDMLRKVNGKVANEDLSFFNVFTEHGNEDKFDKILKTFESRLGCYKDNLPAACGIMEEVLKNADKRFKGKSANEFLTRLRNIMVEKINSLVKKWILEQYKHALQGRLIVEKHKQEYPTVKQRLNALVGTQEERSSIESCIILKASNIYYGGLRHELERDFQYKCSSKSLGELYGYDDVFVSNEFRESFDFQRSECKAVWLKEKLYLKQQVQNVLLEKIATLTQLDIDWLQKARKQQYQYFEAFTWGNSECHWNEIDKKDEEHLKEMAGYAMFKKPLSKLLEGQNDMIQPVVNQIKYQSSYDRINLSCIFVIYLHNDEEVITPVFKVQSSKGVVFVDTVPRTYESWKDYEENNKLPDCVCCYPLKGEYNKKTGFQVVFAETPAASVAKKVFSVFDIVGKVVSVGALGLIGAAAAIPTLPAVMLLGGTVAAVSAGSYGLARGITKISDKVSHAESVNAGDVIGAAGNILAIATAGTSTAAALVMTTTREVLVAQSVVQGLTSITTLVLNSDNYYDVPALLNEMVDISIKVLFYFNSKSSEEAINIIRHSYNLGDDVSKEEVLKALVGANTIGSSVVEEGENLAIEEFVSTGIKSFVLGLCKLINTETTSLMSTFIDSCDENQIFYKMENLYCNLKKENANISQSVMKFVSNSNTFEDLPLLRKAIDDAPKDQKTNFFFLFRNLLYSISAKMDKANRLFETAKHEGHHLQSYCGVEFHPVKEVFDQIKFSGRSRNDANIVNCLDRYINKNVFTLLMEFLKHLCKAANASWNLQDFVECLAVNWSKITATFDNDFKDFQEHTKEFEHQSCDDVSKFMTKHCTQGDLGSSLLEKVLDKIKSRTDFITKNTKNRNSSNVLIVPAWEGLVDHLYCYSISQSSQNVSATQLIEQMLKKPLWGYNEQPCHNRNMIILKSETLSNPSYYVYRSFIDNQECGLIYCSTQDVQSETSL